MSSLPEQPVSVQYPARLQSSLHDAVLLLALVISSRHQGLASTAQDR